MTSVVEPFVAVIATVALSPVANTCTPALFSPAEYRDVADVPEKVTTPSEMESPDVGLTSVTAGATLSTTASSDAVEKLPAVSSIRATAKYRPSVIVRVPITDGNSEANEQIVGRMPAERVGVVTVIGEPVADVPSNHVTDSVVVASHSALPATDAVFPYAVAATPSELTRARGCGAMRSTFIEVGAVKDTFVDWYGTFERGSSTYTL